MGDGGPQRVGGAAEVPAPTREDLIDLYESKARAELAEADGLASGADVIASSGSLIAQVALVKGLPGPAEAAGGAALSGPDGVAADSALSALGYDHSAAFKTLSRPEPGLGREQRVTRLRYVLEAVDAFAIVALDAEAAEDVRDAFGIDRLAFGRPVRAAGRTIVAVDGLEASLADAERKRRVWRQLQSLKV